MNRKQRRMAEAQNKDKQVPGIQAPPDMLLQAVSLHRTGKLDEAETIYKTLLTANPGNAEVINLLGTLQFQRGLSEEGIRLLETAIAIKPDYVEAYYNLGVALQKLQKDKEALYHYDTIITIAPHYVPAYNNRGVALYNLKRYSDALASYDKAIAINPNYAEAYNNRSVTLYELKRYNEALASCDKAIEINPGYADAYNSRGNILHRLKLYDDALKDYHQAIALNPNCSEAYNSLGHILCGLKRPGEALIHYDKAIALNPDYAEAYINKAFLKLWAGDYKEGWKLHEWRWKKKDTIDIVSTFSKPLWLGKESLAGKTILLYAEQGLGDTLQFCRYVPMIEASGAKVLLGVQPLLVQLISTLKGNFNIIMKENPLPDFDFHCSLMSLPLAFGTTLETIPAEIPYLYTTPDKQKIWQDRLGTKVKPRIGLAWSGDAKHKNDHNRSIPLGLFAPLLQCDCDFYSLQKEIRSADAMFLTTTDRIKSYAEDLKDFTDTAALLSEMDLIISVDTSVVHLAGSLGKPVWILLPYAPDFRWMDKREDSPWYPTARLFRQQERDNWDSVMAKVVAELEAFGNVESMDRHAS